MRTILFSALVALFAVSASAEVTIHRYADRNGSFTLTERHNPRTGVSSFYDSRGRKVGSSYDSNIGGASVTRYGNRAGSYQGRRVLRGDGNSSFYGPSGRKVGSGTLANPLGHFGR